MIYHNESDKIYVEGEVKQSFYWIPSVAQMTESVDSLSRSNAEIVNKWIPSAGRMPLVSYSVNFGPFDLILKRLWGFSVNIAC